MEHARDIHKLVVLDRIPREELEQNDRDRPKTRGECENGARPCPWLACRFHLAIDVTWAGSVKYTWGHTDLDLMPETCVLDVADKGGATEQRVGNILGIERQRVQQIEASAFRHLVVHSESIGGSIEGQNE